MAYLRALEKNIGGVIKLLSLGEEPKRALISALQDAPITLQPDMLLRRTVAGVDGIPAEDSREIAEALLNLYTGRAAHSEGGTSEFVEDVIQTLDEGNPRANGEALDESGSQKLREQLTQFLDIKPMAVSTKAASIMFEHDRLFASAKVFSDLRPVFGSSAEDSPQAAIVCHNLVLHYFQSGRHKEFFVVLDTDDIEQLAQTLERAKTKAETLKSVLAAANVPYIEAE